MQNTVYMLILSFFAYIVISKITLLNTITITTSK